MCGSGGRGRNFVVGLVVTLWALSVSGQMISTSLGREWVTPPGLNELGTAAVMGLLAANHQANRRRGGENEEKPPAEVGEEDGEDE